MLGFLLFVSLITLAAYVLWRLHFTRTRKLIDKLPGPPDLPLLGNILQFAFLDQQGLMLTIQENAKKYSPVYRLWAPFNRPMINVTDPRHAEVFLSNNQNIPKSYDYQFISEWLGTGLLTSGGSKWHRRRKQLTPAFHFSILEQFVPTFSDNAAILVDKLRAHLGRPEGVDIVPLVTLCALDIICETAMGTSINAQQNSKSLYVSTIHEVNYLLMYRMLRPWLHPSWVAKISPSGRRQKQCVDILQAFTKKVIRERRVELKNREGRTGGEEKDSDAIGSKKKVAFLDLLIGLSEDGGLTDEDIREEVDTFMFEGHDTTAMGMSWALFFLAANPSVQDKCVSELSEIFGVSDRAPTMSDLGSMKYLERVIKETLRMRPSVYLFGRKLEEKVIMDGYEIPKGTGVQIHIHSIHHNPRYFPDPERFDPDRFLPENCVNRHPYAYIPFSAGQRNCIGQKFALLEEKTVLSTILRNFELRAVDAERDKAMLPDLILRPEHGITVRVTPRVMP